MWQGTAQAGQPGASSGGLRAGDGLPGLVQRARATYHSARPKLLVCAHSLPHHTCGVHTMCQERLQIPSLLLPPASAGSRGAR